jgi:hypothetical protein
MGIWTTRETDYITVVVEISAEVNGELDAAF